MPRLTRGPAIAIVVLLATVGAFALADSWFDRPVSECGDDVVVFAANFTPSGKAYGDRQTAYVDLTQGVYTVQVIASQPITDWGRYSTVSVFGWNAQGPIRLQHE